ncbi:MAG: 3-phosphoshikimate 1-carboxyvinyltransferase [Planctomycetota bacterium]|jgi:3-phosphoshikimate 1-carboxyvinyltransferase
MVVIVRARPGFAKEKTSPAVLPGSKSHSQRAMLLRGLVPGSCRLRGCLLSEDTEVLARALRTLGARVERREDGFELEGVAELPAEPIVLDLGENGTALRSLAAILPMLGIQVRLDGSPGLRARPLGPILSFLEATGIRYEGEGLPLRIDGRSFDPEGQLVVNASLSSQVASGVLMGNALRLRRGLPAGKSVQVLSPSARGYLAVTQESLAACGYPTTCVEAAHGQHYEFGAVETGAAELRIPVDPSAAAFPWVLAAMRGHAPAPAETGGAHPDWGILEDIRRLMAAGPEDLHIDDLGTRPDCFPALVALACMAGGRRVLSGAPSLGGKESDRIAAMAAGLRALDLDCRELPDGLVIEAGAQLPQEDGPRAVPAPADHRIIMALALLGAKMPGGIRLDEDRAVAKSWPAFWDWLGENACLDFA